MYTINTKFEKVLTIKTKKMENQKLKLADLRENQLTKKEALTITGSGGKRIYCIVDEAGNSFNALTGEPIGVKNCGHGGGTANPGEIFEIFI